MVTTPNLAIEHIVTTTLQKEVPFNDAVDELERSTQQELEIDVTAGGTITVTAAQHRHFPLKLTGTPGAGFNLDLPDGDRYTVIINVSGQTATVDTVSGSAPVTVLDGALQKIIVDGIDLRVLSTFELSADLTPQLGGELVGLDRVMSDFLLKDHHAVEATPSSASGTLVLDISTANAFSVLLTENITTLTLSNPHATMSTSIVIKWKQESGSPRSIIYPASVKWAGGTSHAMSVTLDAEDVVELFTVDGGTTWYGFLSGQVMS